MCLDECECVCEGVLRYVCVRIRYREAGWSLPLSIFNIYIVNGIAGGGGGPSKVVTQFTTVPLKNISFLST